MAEFDPAKPRPILDEEQASFFILIERRLP